MSRILEKFYLLKKDKLIESIEKKGRYKIYCTIQKNSDEKPRKLLKELYAIMDNKMKFIDSLDDDEIDLIKQIEVVIE